MASMVSAASSCARRVSAMGAAKTSGIQGTREPPLGGRGLGTTRLAYPIHRTAEKGLLGNLVNRGENRLTLLSRRACSECEEDISYVRVPPKEAFKWNHR